MLTMIEVQVIVYFVVGITIGLTFSTLMMEDKAMDDRMIMLGVLIIFWLPVVTVVLGIGILWSLVKGGDFVARIARSIFKT